MKRKWAWIEKNESRFCIAGKRIICWPSCERLISFLIPDVKLVLPFGVVLHHYYHHNLHHIITIERERGGGRHENRGLPRNNMTQKRARSSVVLLFSTWTELPTTVTSSVTWSAYFNTSSYRLTWWWCWQGRQESIIFSSRFHISWTFDKKSPTSISFHIRNLQRVLAFYFYIKYIKKDTPTGG